ncbi:Serine aminopeptidase, S33 [Desulfatibacillum alkenivorans DSM 16219]|jgi:pimeloyl-ACP methyl ester carboxylesterase|uniref:Serine aminopeptidase, S33 n=1 Tax=Desulfatibacillum alkenivorans DSM 16219 TaxID=1121393 RepID=A0A1M6JR34_9BACT|nr:alpha/beta fold hydrolase [Desulfatibacillum alkenivorans]SHJ49112.1 Serine aminopeptidase, S33 [Desulfatibacillum alkenivorans DSM 16219]
MLISSQLRKSARGVSRLLFNEIPGWAVNTGYDYYSTFYEGQLRLGLPVSEELIKTREELKAMAVGKLALSLYHLFFRATGQRIPRVEIKAVLYDELEKGNLKLTENVIMLTQKQLKHLSQIRFAVPAYFFSTILEEARRRRILLDAFLKDRLPAYFESEIDEREFNGRGDYEIVYYRDYTEEGKEIRFRRLCSMEDVTAGDNRPSVVLIPGFSNNSNCFNVNNRYSLAKDLADRGYWTYLFDPRGMGINEGKFDPFYTVDTLSDYDLPTVVRFVHSRSSGKPSILLGHSMGGMIAEHMPLAWGLRNNFDALKMPSEQKEALDLALPSQKEVDKSMSSVRATICLGSPRFFEKRAHLLFPIALWLNHLARIFHFHRVPIRELFWMVSQPPLLKHISTAFLHSDLGGVNFLVNPENHTDCTRFSTDYVRKAMESVPLGLGFQFLKAIYNGEGFKRMDATRLNYSKSMGYFPPEIPTFHFFGTADPLAPPSNLKFSSLYPHKVKRVFHLKTADDLKNVEITPERSQLVDFVIHGANHLDLLYGKAAEVLVRPLLHRIINQVWDWDGQYSPSAKAG